MNPFGQQQQEAARRRAEQIRQQQEQMHRQQEQMRQQQEQMREQQEAIRRRNEMGHAWMEQEKKKREAAERLSQQVGAGNAGKIGLGLPKQPAAGRTYKPLTPTHVTQVSKPTSLYTPPASGSSSWAPEQHRFWGTVVFLATLALTVFIAGAVLSLGWIGLGILAFVLLMGFLLARRLWRGE